MAYQTLTLDIADGVARLTLNRPADANAISSELALEFIDAVREAESDSGCHVLVLSGNGRFFSAGGDVSGMADATDPRAHLRYLARTASDAMLLLVRSRLIVVSVVHGPAAGAGLALVLNSDLVVAGESASFLAAYAGVGLTPDCGVSHLLPIVVGTRRATELAIGQRVITADVALDWGLVNEVHPDDQLATKAAELAARLAGLATQTLGPTKALLGAAALADYEAALDREIDTISAMGGVQDTQDRIAAFVARKKSKG